MKLADKKTIEEINAFIVILNKYFIKEEYELVSHEVSVGGGLVTALFVIKLKNDFFLKVLKKNSLYHIDFFVSETNFDNIDSFKTRDNFFDFFDILCKRYPDLHFDLDTYYPKNFESTEYFKKYYKLLENKKGDRCYGLKLDNSIWFIKKNYDFIISVLRASPMP